LENEIANCNYIWQEHIDAGAHFARILKWATLTTMAGDGYVRATSRRAWQGPAEIGRPLLDFRGGAFGICLFYWACDVGPSAKEKEDGFEKLRQHSGHRSGATAARLNGQSNTTQKSLAHENETDVPSEKNKRSRARMRAERCACSSASRCARSIASSSIAFAHGEKRRCEPVFRTFLTTAFYDVHHLAKTDIRVKVGSRESQ